MDRLEQGVHNVIVHDRLLEAHAVSVSLVRQVNSITCQSLIHFRKVTLKESPGLTKPSREEIHGSHQGTRRLCLTGQAGPPPKRMGGYAPGFGLRIAGSRVRPLKQGHAKSS